MKMVWAILSLILLTNFVVAFDEEAEFQVVISGELKQKLESKTKILAGTIGVSEDYPAVSVSTTIEDLPLKMPASEFQGRTVLVSFFSPTQKKVVLSMVLSRSLFDKPRKINLKLDAPNPSLKPFFSWQQLRYSPNVSKRMAYVELPYWDNKLKKLVPIPGPPRLRVRLKDRLIQEWEMGSICMGQKRFCEIDPYFEISSGQEIQYSVEYDSGGLFKTIESEFELTYNSNLHTK